MLSFSDFLNTYKKKYVAVRFTPETEAKLRQYAQDNGFDLSTAYDGSSIDPSEFDFHTTVFYTNSYHDTPQGTLPYAGNQFHANGLELFGKNNDTPVITLDTTSVYPLRKSFEDLGYRDNWPDYKPHISLSYAYDGNPIITDIPLPDFPLITENYVVEDQNSD